MYRVGELARAAGVNPRTVDYYTRVGLLKPETQTEAGYRLYAETSVQRLKTILELRAQKFTLEQIGTMLDGPSANAVAEAARLQVELDQLLETVNSLKGAPLDARARSVLNALAIKGMALAHHLLLLLQPEELPPL